MANQAGDPVGAWLEQQGLLRNKQNGDARRMFVGNEAYLSSGYNPEI